MTTAFRSFKALWWQMCLVPLICTAISFSMRYGGSWDKDMEFVTLVCVLMFPAAVMAFAMFILLIASPDAQGYEKWSATAWLVLIIPMFLVIITVWAWLGLGLSGRINLVLAILLSLATLSAWTYGLVAIRLCSFQAGLSRRLLIRLSVLVGIAITASFLLDPRAGLLWNLML